MGKKLNHCHLADSNRAAPGTGHTDFKPILQALKDIKAASVNISITSAENLLKNSVDKNKLDKIYQDSIEETKLALKQKSS